MAKKVFRLFFGGLLGASLGVRIAEDCGAFGYLDYYLYMN
jgi:hypothetical protein